MKPIILINFKTYNQGKKAVKLAEKIEKVDKSIIIAVQSNDVYEISKKTRLKVFSQHVDYFKPGRHTGYILPEAVKKDKGKGTLLNHSEHKLKFSELKKTLKRCKETRLKTAVFVSNIKQAKKVEKLKPDYLIYEPEELVGGKKSVSKQKPEIIKKLDENIKMDFLVGAGIKTKEDVKKALKLGANGIAISSSIVKSKNPVKKLKELIS